MNYQFLRRLKKEGLITLEALYIDGLYVRYNALLADKGYDKKYQLGSMQMFIIEGMDKVREVIEKNRKKTDEEQKISNNRVIDIDNCSPLELLKLQKNLSMIADGEGISFVYGKGKKKSGIQVLYEEIERCGRKLMEYKECFEAMRKGRNTVTRKQIWKRHNESLQL